MSKVRNYIRTSRHELERADLLQNADISRSLTLEEKPSRNATSVAKNITDTLKRTSRLMEGELDRASSILRELSISIVFAPK